MLHPKYAMKSVSVLPLPSPLRKINPLSPALVSSLQIILMIKKEKGLLIYAYVDRQTRIFPFKPPLPYLSLLQQT